MTHVWSVQNQNLNTVPRQSILQIHAQHRVKLNIELYSHSK